MKFNHKTEENRVNIQEALSDFDSVSIDGFICSIELKNWAEVYLDLHLRCIKDRYFNSCFDDFPCEHTENNIEYEFSMFYYDIVDIKNWFTLNCDCEEILKELIQSTPNSEEELRVILELRSTHNSAFNSFENINWSDNSEHIDVEISFFNYGNLKLKKSELSNLNKIKRVYDGAE